MKGSCLDSTDRTAELAEHWWNGRESLLIRPICPEDAQGLEAFFHRLSPEEIAFRFFAPIRDLSPTQLAAFTNLDHERDMALVAERQSDGEIVGLAQLMHEGASHVSEFSIVLQNDVQRQGLAVHLIRRLFGWAKDHEVRRVIGSILEGNTAMLELARFLGFTLTRSPEDPLVVEARLDLIEPRDGGT